MLPTAPEEEESMDVELPEAFYGNTNITNDSDQSNEGTIQSNTPSENGADRRDVEIATGTRTSINIRRAAVNEIIFKDVIAEGRRRLEKKNLGIVRYRSFEREKRKRALDDEVYDEINSFSMGDKESIDDEIDLAKLKRMRYDAPNLS